MRHEIYIYICTKKDCELLKAVAVVNIFTLKMLLVFSLISVYIYI